MLNFRPIQFRPIQAIGAVVVVSAAALDPAPVHAQACPEGRVDVIVVDRTEPFAGEAVEEGARFGWWFRFMNTMHVRTRESTVRRELLFREGDCLEAVLLHESERALRSLSYVTDASVTAEEAPDGSNVVRVATRDAWAVSGGLSLSLDDGISVTGISGNARNVLGTGTRVSLFRNAFRERKRRGALLRQPNLFGSRIDALVHGGRTRSGNTFTQALLRPYAGEVGSNAIRQSYHVRDDYFAYSAAPDRPFSQAYVRFEARFFDVTVQRRFGAPGDVRLITGIGLSRESITFPAGGDGVLVVQDDDFGNPTVADASVRGQVDSQMVPWSTYRVGLTLGVRSFEFERRTGLDALTAAQDVPIGGEWLLTLAPAVSSGRDGLLLRSQASAGAGRGRLYSHVSARSQARYSGDMVGGSRWRDVMLEVEGTSYWNQAATLALFTRVAWAEASRMERPFQLTLGGREGIRGYDNDAFPGARRLLVSVEERWSVPALSTAFADVGFSAFLDAGRVWAGAVPFGTDSGWRASVGGGLRLGMPGGGIDVVRIDFGTPLTGEDGGRGVGLRISAEMLGLLDRRAWPSQMERSRWHGIDADLATRPVNPLARN